MPSCVHIFFSHPIIYFILCSVSFRFSTHDTYFLLCHTREDFERGKTTEISAWPIRNPYGADHQKRSDWDCERTRYPRQNVYSILSQSKMKKNSSTKCLCYKYIFHTMMAVNQEKKILRRRIGFWRLGSYGIPMDSEDLYSVQEKITRQRKCRISRLLPMKWLLFLFLWNLQTLRWS